MKKLKLRTILLFMIISLFMFIPVVSAQFYNWYTYRGDLSQVDLNVGDTVLVDVVPSDGMLRLNLRDEAFCIQQGQHFYNNTKSTVTREITIDGMNATVTDNNGTRTYTDKSENLIMNYIFNQKDEYSPVQNPPAGVSGPERYLSNHDSDVICYIHGVKGKCYSPKQIAIYKYFPTWARAVGMEDLVTNQGDLTIDDQNHPGTLTAGTNMVTDAEEYAEEYNNEKASIYGTSGEQPDIGKEIYVDNGESYIKVGPIKWTYVGDYSRAELYNQNNEIVPVKFGKYEGNELKIYDQISDASKSGQEFYILINTKDNVTKINKFEAEVTKTVKKLTATVWVLTDGVRSNMSGDQGEDYGAQNVIYEKTEEKEETTKDTISITEIPLLGNLEINKTDETTGDKLANVGFTLKATSGEKKGQYVQIDSNGNAIYTENEATIITDINGKITIKSLYPGTYELIETINPNPGYSKEPIVISSNIEVTAGGTTNLDVKNKRIYVNISGYVWEDKSWEEGKEQYDNNYLYQEVAGDINDKRVENIVVQLKDKNNNIIMQETTDLEGNYRFQDVLIEGLKDYYIEFLYNGICYESVPVVDLTKENGTKAIESTKRQEFNSKYEKIAKGDETAKDIGEAQNANGEEVYKLKYDTSEKYTSKILYGEKSEYKYGYEGQKYPISGIDEQYLITANTKEAYLTNNTQNQYTGYLTDIKTEEEIMNNSITEIENINLGIMEREQPDLSLKKDLDSARVIINNAEHIYKYADRFNNINEYGDGYSMDPNIKFEEKYANMTYTRALYASDINYDDETKGLTVKATYKIGITNLSGTLGATINEISDFYDSKYKIVDVGTQINEDGSIKTPIKYKVDKETDIEGEYNKITIEPNLKVESEKESFIYVEVEVKKDKIINILGNASSQDEPYVKLDNIAEISSYSIIDENGAYAGIDIDSQPGSSVPGETTTYEDDTDRAPGFKLVLQEQRTVSGIVFEDNAEFENPENGHNQEIHTGKIRQGNGLYDEAETKITGVEVKIINAKDGSIAKMWDSNERTWKDAITKTDENGNYEIGGLIPGDYQVIYTWGDNTYKVQDYKSTIVVKESWESKNSNEEWYKQNVDARESDAVDDLNLRRQIDQNNSETTNKTKQEIQEAYNNGLEEEGKTRINSSTPIFKINVEYSKDITNSNEEYVTNENGELVIDENGYVVKQDGHKNIIKNIDFGIIRRAKQVLQLDKRISGVKVTLTNGNVLIDARNR